MKECAVCGAKEEERPLKFINKQWICWGCYRARNDEVYKVPKYGEIGKTSEGLIICHICGRAFKRPMSHVTQVHGMTALEYKHKFGLDLYNGIISEDSKELARKRVYENWDKVKNNLLEGGKKYRFRKGYEGRIKEKMSFQTARRLKYKGGRENDD